MLKNTELFFKTVKKFQDGRNDINSTYEKRMKELERTKGSQYYVDESAKAQTARDNALKALKAECGESLNDIISFMQRANKQRPMKAPSDEELRLLQLLKMKESISEGEFESAALALKANPTALATLNEIAHSKGILRNFNRFADVKTMSADETNSALRQLAKNVNDFLEFDTKKTARIAAEYQANHYGQSESRPLPKREPFTDMRGAMRELLPGMNEDRLESFYNAVDGIEGTIEGAE